VRRARFATVVWLLSTTAALAAEPFARAVVTNKGTIVPGQQVQLSVDVFVPDFFTSPPQFPLFDLPNAVVTLPAERAMNSVQTIDGVQYSVIRRTYAIVPEVSGAFTVPPIAIALGYSDNGRPLRGEAKLASVSFTVGEAPAASGNRLAFAARGLTLTQSFDREPSSLKVGDAIVRTVTVFAEDTQAMMIPPVDVGQAIGLKQYQGPSTIADNISQDRTTTGSAHTDKITYTAETAGTFDIPAVSYSWFNTDAHQQEAATLPASTVTVAVAVTSDNVIEPQLQPARPPERSRLSARTLLEDAACLLAVVPLYWATTRLLSWCGPRFRNWRLSLAHSEWSEFRLLEKTITTGDDKAAYNALASWSRFKGYESLSEWTRESADPILMLQVGALERQLFGAKACTSACDRSALCDAVRRRRHAARVKVLSHSMALPPLNPT
jgi:hypothetical protein